MTSSRRPIKLCTRSGTRSSRTSAAPAYREHARHRRSKTVEVSERAIPSPSAAPAGASAGGPDMVTTSTSPSKPITDNRSLSTDQPIQRSLSTAIEINDHKHTNHNPRPSPQNLNDNEPITIRLGIRILRCRDDRAREGDDDGPFGVGDGAGLVSGDRLDGGGERDQVAYRVGNGDMDVRRVRFVGAGQTATGTGFRPGELLSGARDLRLIEMCVFRGVPNAWGEDPPLAVRPRPGCTSSCRDLGTLEVAGLDSAEVFTSRDTVAWWRALTRASDGNRSVSFLTASGSVRRRCPGRRAC